MERHRRGGARRDAHPGLRRVLTPGTGWFLYFFLIPVSAMFPMVIVGVNGALTLLAIYLVAFPVAKLVVSRSGWCKRAQNDLRREGTATVGGFVLGGASGSSWSSRSSSGGGSSGSW